MENFKVNLKNAMMEILMKEIHVILLALKKFAVMEKSSLAKHVMTIIPLIMMDVIQHVSLKSVEITKNNR